MKDAGAASLEGGPAPRAGPAVRVASRPRGARPTAVIEADGASIEEVCRSIEGCRVYGYDAIVRCGATERVARLIGSGRVDGRPCLRIRAAPPDTWRLEAALRLLDAALGFLILTASLPALALIALAVKLTSRGPVFHRAQVVGRNGESFVWRKFRTMRVGADDTPHREAARRFITGSDDDFRRVGVFKMRSDDRTTAVGRWLRRHSLDELPQILDVLAGRMSLVGPRPCLPYEWALYAPHHRERLAVRPGMTGLWQVHGRSRVAFEEMVLLDLCWVWNRSVRLYLATLARTGRVVLRGEGGF